MGLGAMFGGYLYNGLGASLCFRTCSALPSISLLLLAIPAGQSWFCCAGRWWREGTGERGLGGWDDNESHSLAQVSSEEDPDGSEGEGFRIETLDMSQKGLSNHEGCTVGGGTSRFTTSTSTEHRFHFRLRITVTYHTSLKTGPDLPFIAVHITKPETTTTPRYGRGTTPRVLR